MNIKNATQELKKKHLEFMNKVKNERRTRSAIAIVSLAISIGSVVYLINESENYPKHANRLPETFLAKHSRQYAQTMKELGIKTIDCDGRSSGKGKAGKNGEIKVTLKDGKTYTRETKACVVNKIHIFVKRNGDLEISSNKTPGEIMKFYEGNEEYLKNKMDQVVAKAAHAVRTEQYREKTRG